MFNRFEQFTTAISQINKSVQRIKSTEVNSYGLKANHVMILFQLKKNPAGLTPSQLCENCEVDKAAISRSLKELTGKGFVHDAAWAEFSAMPLAGSDDHPPLFADSALSFTTHCC